MPTDKERREVARRLRELENPYWHGSGSSEAYMDVMGVETYLRRNGLHYDLADLIEPTTGDYDEGYRAGLQKARDMCDRDALLALADEFDEQAETIARHIESSDGDFDRHAIDAMEEQYGYARRIREACGVGER